jgi:hypothetical protein
MFLRPSSAFTLRTSATCPYIVDVRHDGVTVRLITITDDDFGLSERDLELARQISAIARELGVPLR